MRSKYFLFSILVIGAYLGPYIICGQNTHILIHDNLDSNLSNTKVLAESGEIFGSLNAKIWNTMNGVPRNIFGSEFNLMLWLVYFFGPFTAYVLNQVFMHSIAFIGMFLLLKRHLICEASQQYVVVGVALAFALLPFWPFGQLSIAGQPLALYAFLNIRNHKANLKDWLIVLFVPFYSLLVASFTFFLIALGVLWIYDLVKKKTLNYEFLGAVIIQIFIFLLIEYRLVYSIFIDNNFISHRQEFNRIFLARDLVGSIRLGVGRFIRGHPHTPSLHEYFILFSVGMAFLIMLFKRVKENRMLILLAIIGLISGFYGLWYWRGTLYFSEKIAILRIFGFQRFHWLTPLIWYLVFALSLNTISKSLKIGKYMAFVLIILQATFNFYHHENFQERKKGMPSYKSFYAEKQFDEIADFIGENKDSYRVVSIGMHPAIALYNGFYTLDAYLPNYSLKYKHEFGKIIAFELEKNKSLKEYFNYWGNRCYIFVSELGKNFMCTIDKNYKIRYLDLNIAQFKKMGGKYLFSAVKIENYHENNLQLLKIFENENSPWRVYLYEGM